MGEDATAPEGGAGFEVDLSFSSGFSELMDELNMEDFFGEGHGEENDQMISKCVQNAIVRLPLADPTAQVRLEGNNVYRGAVRVGFISSPLEPARDGGILCNAWPVLLHIDSIGWGRPAG